MNRPCKTGHHITFCQKSIQTSSLNSVSFPSEGLKETNNNKLTCILYIVDCNKLFLKICKGENDFLNIKMPVCCDTMGLNQQHVSSFEIIFLLFFFIRRLNDAMKQWSVAICSFTPIFLCSSANRSAGQCLTISITVLYTQCHLRPSANLVCNNNALAPSVYIASYIIYSEGKRSDTLREIDHLNPLTHWKLLLATVG